jgi:PAS domain S-box-containing protein
LLRFPGAAAAATRYPAILDPVNSEHVGQANSGHARGAAPAEERFRLLVDSVQDYAIFMLDPRGHVLSWNKGAARLKGYAADEIIGRSFEVFYPGSAVATGWPQEELRLAIANGRFEDEGWRVRKDGSHFWANVVITPLCGPDGALQGFAKVTRDLSERRRHEELLRRSEEQFRLLLESVKDYAIYMVDVDGRVLTWNAGAQAIQGYSADEVLGRHFSMFFTQQDVAAGVPDAELEASARAGIMQTEGWRVRRDGELFWANVISRPVMDASGQLRGFAKVTRDLTEQRRIGELERSNQRTQEFIAMLAHELRNPLAPIRNAVSILQAHQGLPAPVQRVGDVIGRQISHLTRLVDDLLDVGRIVTGKIVLKNEPMDYRQTVQLSIEAMRPLIDRRGHRLVVRVPDDPIEMIGDATRLAQALQNLLQNAARYTPERGEIGVTVRVDRGCVVTTVSDTGIGIAPDALERIFELFVQERVNVTPHESGLGIGLSLARTLVEQHGGDLRADSAGAGRGSQFTVTLPLRDRPAGGRVVATPAKNVQEGGRSLRVLVVDDNTDSADTMVDLLSLLGHEARSAYGAKQAIETAEGFHPQLVLLDLNMTDGDGFSVLQALRALAHGPMYVAAMTGYGQQEDRDHTLAAGFQAHLTKPIGPELLMQTLDDVSKALTS